MFLTERQTKHDAKRVSPEKKNESSLDIREMMNGLSYAFSGIPDPVQMQEEEEEEVQMKEAPIQQQSEEGQEKEEEKLVQGKTASTQFMVREEEERPMQAKAKNLHIQTPTQTPSTRTTTKMPEGVQAKMENSFGIGFSGVNIHQNDDSAMQMGALAYTQGNDVHFAPGQYNPNTQTGQELLGHELTHVVQQRAGRVKDTKQGKGFSVNDDKALENEADVMGKKASQGEDTSKVTGKGNGVQKQDGENPWDKYKDYDPSTFLLTKIVSIKDEKLGALRDWAEIAERIEEKPGLTVLKIALGILSAGVVGVFGGILSSAIGKAVSQAANDFITESSKKILDNILTGLISNTTIDGAAKNSVSKSGLDLKGYFVSSSYDMFTDEFDSQGEMIAKIVKNSNSETLSKLCWVMDLIREEMDSADVNNNIKQQLTIGYLKLQDEVYTYNRAGVQEGEPSISKERMISDKKKRDNNVSEEGARMGRLHFEGKLDGIPPSSISLNIEKGLYSDINSETANLLQGMSFGQLSDLTLSFDFDAKDCNWNFWTEDIFRSARVAFEIGKHGIFVDTINYDSTTTHYSQGPEWLATFYLGYIPDEVNDNDVNAGVRKLFDLYIKGQSIPKLEVEWF